jgi:hypothetical membrane protein
MSDARLSRIALLTLVVGLGVLILAVAWGGAVYPGYDHTRQFMSELGATGAPTGPSVSTWGFVPNGVLITLFCLLAAWILRGSRLAVAACLLLALNGVGMTGAGVYPCDFECSRSDPSDAALLHDLFAVAGYLCAILGVALAAAWARKSDASFLAPLGLIVLIVSIVGLSAVVAELEFAGLHQRVMEAALGVFMLALGWPLVKGARGLGSERG